MVVFGAVAVPERFSVSSTMGFSGACLVPVGFVALVSLTDANFEHKPFLHTFGILAHLQEDSSQHRVIISVNI